MDNKFLDKLAKQAEENPIVAIGVGAALITAISKLMDARGNMRNSRAWSREVNRRVRRNRSR
jgi:hypothetical protein